ncbi:MAG: hypothetical protein AB2825_18640 [Candidatus Thiodiazotropha endolucinida]
MQEEKYQVKRHAMLLGLLLWGIKPLTAVYNVEIVKEALHQQH